MDVNISEHYLDGVSVLIHCHELISGGVQDFEQLGDQRSLRWLSVVLLFLQKNLDISLKSQFRCDEMQVT